MTEKFFKVLLIEGDSDYAHLLEMRLTRKQTKDAHWMDFQLTHALSMSEAEQILNRERFDLVLLDLSFPDSKEFDGLQRIKHEFPTLVIVVFTMLANDDLAMAALQHGAQDYLVKDEVTIEYLRRAMQNAVKRGQLLTALETKHVVEIQASEANLHNVVNHILDGIAVVDLDGIVCFDNPAISRLLGRNEEEFRSQPFMYPLRGQTISEIHMKSGNGVDRFLEIRTTLINWNNKPAHLVLVRDISEQKRAAMALEQYTRELEVRNEDLNAFAHTVAHNLKAPLTQIVLAADLLDLNKQSIGADCNQYVKTIVNYSHKMTDIIDELLLLAEVRTREDLLLLPLNMMRVVKDVEARLRSLFTQHSARLTLSTNAQAWPHVIGYTPWIEEVWANYFTNGIKFGGRPPRLEAGADVLPNGMVRFWVRDNGEGIPPEQMRQLFQPFSRLKPYNHDGNGLGLAIVRRIIEKLGGEVGVESQLGVGSTFSFTLPAK